MQRVWLVAGVFVASAGCGKFLAEDGTGEPPATGDAADAASDVTVVPPDGATGEGGAMPDAAFPATPCNARFCSPFDDEAGALPFNWDRIGPSGAEMAGILGTRTDTFLSGPRALRAQSSNTGALEQWLEKKFDSASSGSIHLAMRVEFTPVSVTRVRFLTLNCDDGGDAARVVLEPDRKLSLSTQDDNFTAQPSAVVPFQSWVGLHLAFDYDGGKKLVSKLTFSGETTTEVLFDRCGSPFKVRLGATLSAQGVFDIAFDDVAIDWSP